LSFVKQHIHAAIVSRVRQLPKFLLCIEHSVMNHVEALYKTSVASIEAACQSEQVPSTFNHYFSENITKQRVDKQRRQLQSLADEKGNIPYKTVEMVLNQNNRKSIDDFVAEEMLIVLDSYGETRGCPQHTVLHVHCIMTNSAGKVASKRYGDDIPNVLATTFIQKLPTFSFASSISDDELEALVAQPRHVTQKRIELQDRLQKIEEALALSQTLQLTQFIIIIISLIGLPRATFPCILKFLYHVKNPQPMLHPHTFS
jgi:hypothetical protein